MEKIRPILDPAMPLGEQFTENYRNLIKLDWIFSSWWEKLLIISSLAWGLISLVKLAINLFN